MGNKIRNFFTHLMDGRNGLDELGRFMLIVFFILFFIELIFGGVVGSVCYWLSLVDLILVYFRMFSRNLYQRTEENNKYLDLKGRLMGGRGGRGNRNQYSDPNHKIYSCPQCGQKVRVPKGRGKVQIRCPKCGRQFIKRT